MTHTKETETMARETITSATEQARDESTIYGQGTGWVVSTYDEQMRLNYTAHEAPWRIARANLTQWRQDRIVELLARAGETEKARSYIRRLTGLEYGTPWANCSVSYDDKARASELYEMTEIESESDGTAYVAHRWGFAEDENLVVKDGNGYSYA